MQEVIKAGEYEFTLGYYQQQMFTLTSTKPLPENVSLRYPNGDYAVRIKDIYLLTSVDPLFILYIDDEPRYKIYRNISYNVIEIQESKNFNE